MFMRLVQLKLDSSYDLDMFKQFYDTITIPELKSLPGCIYAGLIQSRPQSDEYLSMTLWKTRKDADHYESSGTYQKLIEMTRPYLAESTTWHVQLSDNLELNYEPQTEEPVLSQFSVTALSHSEQDIPRQDSPMYVRIVSAKIQPGKMEEFRNLYSTEIIPALRETPGCRYAFLTENLQEENEIISVTIWDSKEDAQYYEESGRFEELTKKVAHTLSSLYQWKMALQKKTGERVKTSDDLKVTHYNVVTGKKFD